MILNLLYWKDIKIFLDFFFPRTMNGMEQTMNEWNNNEFMNGTNFRKKLFPANLCIFKSKLIYY